MSDHYRVINYSYCYLGVVCLCCFEITVEAVFSTNHTHSYTTLNYNNTPNLDYFNAEGGYILQWLKLVENRNPCHVHELTELKIYTVFIWQRAFKHFQFVNIFSKKSYCYTALFKCNFKVTLTAQSHKSKHVDSWRFHRSLTNSVISIKNLNKLAE